MANVTATTPTAMTTRLFVMPTKPPTPRYTRNFFVTGTAAATAGMGSTRPASGQVWPRGGRS